MENLFADSVSPTLQEVKKKSGCAEKMYYADRRLSAVAKKMLIIVCMSICMHRERVCVCKR
jgi:hypothetical protein